MDYKPEVFVEQFLLVKHFLYHLTYFRELSMASRRCQIQSELWTHTIDAHLIQATMIWGMVFGSDGCNPTHWKNLSDENCKELQASFRQRLCEVTGLSTDQWSDYCSEITSFRNRYVAHRELNYDEPVPGFTIALDIALLYDRWVREIIAPDILEEPPLDQFIKALRAAVVPLIEKLYSITIEYNTTAEQFA
jgi:hypothetical protein